MIKVSESHEIGKANLGHGRLKSYFLIGLCLMAAFLTAQVSHWRWPWLSSLQTNDAYKQISGFLVAGYVAFQWRLSILRAKAESPVCRSILERHKLVGAFAPLFFFAHSQQIGYAYLEALSLVYFVIFLTGLCHQEITQLHKPFLGLTWIILHVGLSVVLLFLLGYHIYTSYMFE